MPSFPLTAADFASLMTKVAPTGDAWPAEPDAVQQQSYLALAATFQRLNDRANYLTIDAFPATTDELLPEWELSLGLPDPCAGEDATVALRQAHVVARLTYRGGQSIAYFVGYMATLGIPITIEQFAPARVGSLCAGDSLNGDDWAFTWLVHAPATDIFYFDVGSGRAGDPLSTFGNTVIACELDRIAPAHTILQIAYGD